MFAKLTDKRIQAQRKKTFPDTSYYNLNAAILDNYGSNQTSVKLLYVVRDDINNLKIFGNIKTKKMMYFRIFEIPSQQALAEIQAIKNIKDLNNYLQLNGLFYKDINAGVSFIGNNIDISEHYVKDGYVYLNYNFDFLLNKKDMDYLSFGAVFYYDTDAYSQENDLLKQTINYEMIFGDIKFDNLILNSKPNSPSLKDLRIIKNIFGSDRLYQQVQLKNTGIKNVNPNIITIPTNQYFSNIYYSRKNNSEISMLFNLDFKKLVIDNSPLKEVVNRSQLTDDLLNQSDISNIVIKRRLVKIHHDKSSKCKISYTPSDTFYENVISTQDDKLTGLLKQSENSQAIINETTLNTFSDIKLRTVQIADKDFVNKTSGYYQYGIELSIFDGLIEYLDNLRLQLAEDNKKLSSYLKETENIVIFPSSIRNLSPHSQINSRVKAGYYDPLVQKFTPEFLYVIYPQRYEDTIGVAIARFTEALKILGVTKLPIDDIQSSTASLLSPFFATSETISYFIKIHTKLINEINKLLKNSYNNNYKISHWFENDFVSAEDDLSVGYSFISDDGKELIGSIQDSYLTTKISEEVVKYSNDATLELKSINSNDLKYSQFSPIAISLASDKMLDLDKLLEERNYYDLETYKQFELDIKRYVLLNKIPYNYMGYINPNISSELQKKTIKNNTLFDNKSILFDIFNIEEISDVKQPDVQIKNSIDPTLLFLGLSKFFNTNISQYKNYDLTNYIPNNYQSYLMLENKSRFFQTNEDIDLRNESRKDQEGRSTDGGEKEYNKLTDLDYASKYTLLYTTVHSIEVLSYGQNNLKNEIWTPLNEQTFLDLENKKSILCRLNPTDNLIFDQIALPVYNRYFIINNGNLKPKSFRKPIDRKPPEPPRPPFIAAPPPPVIEKVKPPTIKFTPIYIDPNKIDLSSFNAPQPCLDSNGNVDPNSESYFNQETNSWDCRPKCPPGSTSDGKGGCIPDPVKAIEVPAPITYPCDANLSVPGDYYDQSINGPVLAPNTRFNLRNNHIIKIPNVVLEDQIPNEHILLRSKTVVEVYNADGTAVSIYIYFKHTLVGDREGIYLYSQRRESASKQSDSYVESAELKLLWEISFATTGNVSSDEVDDNGLQFITLRDGRMQLFTINGSGAYTPVVFSQNRQINPSNSQLILQGDGNLVLYENNTPVWATNSGLLGGLSAIASEGPKNEEIGGSGDDILVV